MRLHVKRQATTVREQEESDEEGKGGKFLWLGTVKIAYCSLGLTAIKLVLRFYQIALSLSFQEYEGSR